jgi:hypothetical protein
MILPVGPKREFSFNFKDNVPRRSSEFEIGNEIERSFPLPPVRRYIRATLLIAVHPHIAQHPHISLLTRRVRYLTPAG